MEEKNEAGALQRLENEIIEDKSGRLQEEELIKERKDKFVNFFKKNYNWVSYIILVIIVYISVKIRTRNLQGLKDITTGTWTLGPDLDPFLFLRWAKHIVANGSLMVIDTMRYSPLGFNTKGELILHPYMIAWFHKYLGPLFGTESVTHSAVLYPVFFFAITVIAFFFMVRKIFVDFTGEKNANIIALISSFFLTVIPSLLPRTIAGIPEKESAAFFFMFMAFYLFLSAWKAKKNRNRYLLAALSGAFTAGMALVWGGFAFLYLTIAPAMFLAFILGKVGKTELYTYFIWILSSFLLMAPFSTRYSIGRLLPSIDTGLAVAVFLVIAIHFLIFNTKLKEKFSSGRLAKVPPQVISVAISLVLITIISSVFFGASFIPEKIDSLSNSLVKPATSRLIQTVAENRQPYFTEWSNSFGPHIRSFAVTFWLFFFGSIYLFYNLIKSVKIKDRVFLTLSYFVFLVAIIFSRYSPESRFNGENFISLAFYALGFIVLFGTAGFYYYKYYKNHEEERLKKIDFSMLVLFVFFFLSTIASRGAVRLIMILVIPVSIVISYFVVASYTSAKNARGNVKMAAWAFVIILTGLILFAGYNFYKSSNAQAAGQAPTVYTHQWQKAMSWVRENTPEDAVFGHWWDYGYWLQSIGERTTVLDGGNAQSYWNHMMGRYALTGGDDRKAVEFLYAHNVTHFLIDSTDIGKYSAFSSIGSDADYDRASYIPTFARDEQRTQETKENMIYLYAGATGLDEDIVYEQEGERIFLPRGQSGLGGILITKDKEGKMVEQPQGLFVSQSQQYLIPLRYAFDNELIDFGSGLEAGVFIFPRAIQSGANLQIDKEGVLFYLSPRTIKSQVARHYLFDEESEYYKLVHSEEDIIVEQIKEQNPDFDSDFLNYQGLRGPIKIWEISYPEDIEFKEEYVSTYYPPELRYTE